MPLIFKKLEELRRSLVRLWVQRNRFRKQVHDISAQATKFKPKKMTKETGQDQRYGRYIWIKKEVKDLENYTGNPCTQKQKFRNHRGYRRKKQDIQSIIKRCICSFQQLIPNAQTLPALLAKLPALLDHGFNEFFFLFEFFMDSMHYTAQPSIQSKVFTGSTPP